MSAECSRLEACPTGCRSAAASALGKVFQNPMILRAQRSDRFVNSQSAQQAHETNGAKRLVWPMEPKRSDEPIIRRRLCSTLELQYHSTTRAWLVAVRGFVSEQPQHRAGAIASTSPLSRTTGSPNSAMRESWNVNAHAGCASRCSPNSIG